MADRGEPTASDHAYDAWINGVDPEKVKQDRQQSLRTSSSPEERRMFRTAEQRVWGVKARKLERERLAREKDPQTVEDECTIDPTTDILR